MKIFHFYWKTNLYIAWACLRNEIIILSGPKTHIKEIYQTVVYKKLIRILVRRKIKIALFPLTC